MTSSASDLTGRVVLLTGGRGFLGEYFARALSEAGATVVVSDITDDVDVQLDVTDQESVGTAIDQVVAKYGGIDAVVNNAAIDPKVDTADMNARTFVGYPEEAMQRSVDVNMLGPWRVCKAVIPHMQDRGGVIINTTSFYGVTPPRQEIYPQGVEKPVDYGMTKAALIMLTRHLASQFGADGIRVNALAPGGVERDHDDEFKAAYGAHTSFGRMNTPEEVADALVFLCSDASRGMTGETLVVDAGWHSR